MNRLFKAPGQRTTRDSLQQLVANLYEEIPVSMEEFLYSARYLNQKGILFPKVADLLVEADDPGTREIYLQIGRGGGKSTFCSVLMARVIYRLLCLRDPHAYYQCSPSDKIAVVNMSVEEGQAEDVIFHAVKTLLAGSPWFTGRYKENKRELEFPKQIMAVAGNSSSRSKLGYHIFCGIVDEANFFPTPAQPAHRQREGRDVVDSVVTAIRNSQLTRFKEDYKLAIISSAHRQEDYLQKLITQVEQRGVEVPWDGLGKNAKKVTF